MSNKVIKLTERDLESIIEKVISEQPTPSQLLNKKITKITSKESQAYYKEAAKRAEKYVKSNNESDVIEGKDLVKVNADEGLGEEKKGVIQDYNYGLTDLRYENEPSKRFKERAEMALKGDSRMGNGETEATVMNDDVKDKQLGEKIIAAAKAKFKAEQESPYSSLISMGDDIEKSKGASKVRKLAFEGIIEIAKEKLLKEGIKLSNKEIADSLKEEMGGYGYGFKQETEIKEGWGGYGYENYDPETGEGKDTYPVGNPDEIAEQLLQASSGMGTDEEQFVRSFQKIDSADTANKVRDALMGKADRLPECCEKEEYKSPETGQIVKPDLLGCLVVDEIGHQSTNEFFAISAHARDFGIDIRMKTTEHPKCGGITTMEEETEMLSEKGKCRHMYCEDDDGSCQPCRNIGQDPGIEKPVGRGKTRRTRPMRRESVENIAENKKYKRLKYSKEFKSVDQALTLIPEHYKVDGKILQLTDNNNYITIRWEGDKKTGEGVVLLHKNTGKMNENINRMKNLMGYKFGDTLNEQHTQAGFGYGFKSEQGEVTVGKPAGIDIEDAPEIRPLTPDRPPFSLGGKDISLYTTAAGTKFVIVKSGGRIEAAFVADNNGTSTYKITDMQDIPQSIGTMNSGKMESPGKFGSEATKQDFADMGFNPENTGTILALIGAQYLRS